MVLNWLVKPFSMALLGWLFFKGLFADWVDPQTATEYIAGMILLGVAPCTAMVFVWSQLTKGDANRRYADFALDSTNRQLVAVCEQHSLQTSESGAHTEPQNLLVSINLDSGEEHTLHSGHDFYAAPRICEATNEIAFITWDHPAMPWDSTRLYQAKLGPSRLEDLTQIEGGADESITQPSWLQDASLVFASVGEHPKG